MKNLISILLSAEEYRFSFNFNLLETNVINIVLLLAFLIYAASTNFKLTLERRKAEIVDSLSFAQSDFLKSLNYYKASKFDLDKSLTHLQSWRSLYLEEKKEEIALKHKNAKQKILNQFIVTENLIKNFEAKAFISIERYIILRVACQMLRKFFCLSKKDQSKLLEQIIFNLGGV
jgi:F0F1-type ATP synthase membrane subunit b/b'